MTGPSAVQHGMNTLRRWFGTNRGTHWTVAGSVAVAIFAIYFVYSNRNPTAATDISAIERTLVPMAPVTLN
jgi:hypothetical protein